MRWSSFFTRMMPGKARVLFTHGNTGISEPSATRYADARALREREVFRVLQLLLKGRKIFHLPGDELLLVLWDGAGSPPAIYAQCA